MQVQFSSLGGQLERLKTFYIGEKKVEIFYRDKGLFAYIWSQQTKIEVPYYDISGVPKHIQSNIEVLREFFKDVYLTLNSLKDGKQQRFSIYVKGSLKGGGTPFSKAKASHSEAQNQARGNHFTTAIARYESAIQDIKAAQAKNYTGEDAISLSTMLREAYFGLASMQEAVGEIQSDMWDLAIENYKNAQQNGEEKAKEKRRELALKLAEMAEHNRELGNQEKYLAIAKQAGSLEAATRLAAIKKQAQEDLEKEIASPESFHQLIKRPAITSWKAGVDIGRGFNIIDGSLRGYVIKSPQCKTVEINSLDETNEFLVWEKDDITKITHLKAGCGTLQDSWSIKAIAEYASGFLLDQKKVYCIIACTYSPPSQEVYAAGNLFESDFEFLKKEGFTKFIENNGTHFIAGRKREAIFLACMTLTVQNEDEVSILRAGLKGSIKGLIEGTTLAQNSSLEMLQKRLNIFRTKTIGLKKPFEGTVDNLETLRKQHAEFRTLIQNPDNLTPIAAICEPWTSLAEVKQYLVSDPEFASLNGLLIRSRNRVLQDESVQALNRMYTPLKCVKTFNNINVEDKGEDLCAVFDNFLKGHKKVFVLLGEAGGGKSSFLKFIERQLWDKMNTLTIFDSYIPIRLELSTLNGPIDSIVSEHLSRQGFSESQKQELKHHGKILFMIDELDERKEEGKPIHNNLYVLNKLQEWNGKVLIAGRLNATPALEPERQDHLHLFAPILDEKIRTDLVEEFIICPFFPTQIAAYINKFVKNADAKLQEDYRSWFEVEGALFHRIIKKNKNLESLVKTPFILRSVIEVLPKIAADHGNELDFSLIRYDVYRYFTDACFEREEVKYIKRGEKKPAEFATQNTKQHARSFCQQIASQMYKLGITSVVYDETDENIYQTWELYFGDTEGAKFLRSICSDVIRKSTVYVEGLPYNQYSIAHTELRNYLISLSKDDVASQ